MKRAFAGCISHASKDGDVVDDGVDSKVGFCEKNLINPVEHVGKIEVKLGKVVGGVQLGGGK